MADQFDPTSEGAVAIDEPFDPTQHGAIPLQHEEPSILQKTGRAVVDTLKSFLPQSFEDVALTPVRSVPGLGNAGTILSNVAFGKPIAEGLDPLRGIPVAQRIPQIVQAEKTPALSQERFTAGAGVVADLAMIAGLKSQIHPEIAPETAAAEAAPIVPEPITPEPQPVPEAVAPTTAPLSTEPKAIDLTENPNLPPERPRLAIKLDDGTILHANDVALHSQLLEKSGVEPSRVVDSGTYGQLSGTFNSLTPESVDIFPKPTEEVIPNAAQEPKTGEIFQREPQETGATGSERVGVEQGVQGQEVAQVSPETVARPEPTLQSTFSVEVPTDGFGTEHTPISSFLINDVGGVVSKNAASKSGKLKLNPDLWDDVQNLSHPTHNKIYNPSGELPDTAAQSLYDAGLISDPSPATMWKAIADESKSSRSTLASQRKGTTDVKEQIGQIKNFSDAQRDNWKKGEPLVQVRDLQVGDAVKVKDEPLKVTDIDPDTFDVTLEDGKKYGVQTVKDNTVIYGEHEPIAQPQTQEVAPESTGSKPVASTVPEAITAEPLPKTEVPTPAEALARNSGETTGIAARYREEEQPGSVIEGVGKTPDEARAFGHDYINKGGNPYDAINNKGPKRELWQDVGIARAEYERLGNEKRAAEAQLEANPNDPQAQMAFDNADLAQRKWSKDAQPILTRAGDALRAATRSYPREINTFSDFTDIVNDHFKGEVELTPEKRVELQKAVKAIKKGNLEATEARAKVTDAAVKKAGGKVLSPEDLKTDLQCQMAELLKNCIV